ncbi:IPT/TIG domain-containing protein [uncultured Jatrophihabitans sp.]|uniref:IPT/TIG domain-containing protein n=1 Tax=uncultured Jatrophihabitans sp. TaxID=1610747 RepID=UPI0035CA94B9
MASRAAPDVWSADLDLRERQVRVTTAGVTSAVIAADRFTFVAPPSLSRLNPARGSHAGGTRVTITGSNLSGASRVVFGSTAAIHLTRVSSRTLVVTTPAHARGTVSVRVTTPGGTSVARSSTPTAEPTARVPMPRVIRRVRTARVVEQLPRAVQPAARLPTSTQPS